MNCQDTMEYLNDAIDGTLDEALQQPYDAHMASCPECREEERLMRELLDQAAQLPTNILPERDLWAGIEGKIQNTPNNVVAFPKARKRLMRTAIAAAAAVIVFMLVTVPIEPETDIATNEPSQEEIVHQKLQAEYALAKDSLMSALDARKEEMSPEMLATIEDNLNIIENAVVDINRALATNPNDPQLERMLQAAYHSEVTLLQHAVQLEDDDS